MNREIKFEYGFESANRLIKRVYHLHEIPNIAFKCDVWGDLPIKYVRQYTGLKDKNSKEIYEGDILKDTITKMVYTVKFGLCFKRGYNGWYVHNEEHSYTTSINGDYDTNNNSMIEIIGNIYENPELLK